MTYLSVNIANINHPKLQLAAEEPECVPSSISWSLAYIISVSWEE